MRTTIVLALMMAPAVLDAQEAVRLRLGGSAGQFNRYQMTAETWMRGGPMAAMGGDTSLPMSRMIMFTTRTLQAVAGDTLTFVEAVDSARFESPAMPQMAQMGGGQAAAMLVGSSTTTRSDSRGRVYSIATQGGPSMPARGPGGPGGRGRGGRGMMGANNDLRPMFGLPERAVRVGESWTDSSTVQAENMTTALQATYRLERIETRGRARVAVISINGNMAMSTPRGPQNMSVGGELQIDVSNNRVAAFTMDASGFMNTDQGEVPMRMRLVQRLI